LIKGLKRERNSNAQIEKKDERRKNSKRKREEWTHTPD
jgi:hypothetical protein